MSRRTPLLLAIFATLLALPVAVFSQVVFKNVTDSSGLFCPTSESYSYSSIWVDIDNDGLLDLYVARGNDHFDELNQLFHNLGNGKFKEIHESAFPTAVPSYTGQLCWGDFNNDGFIDCYESHFNTTDDWIWVNNGDMTFHDGRNLFTQPGMYATGAIFSDINSDGKLDLLINTQAFQGSSVQLNNGVSFDVIKPFFNGGQGDEILATYINDDSIPDYMFGNARGLDSLFFSSPASPTGFINFDNSFLRNVRELNDYPGAAAFADLDNDGYPDLLVHYPNKLFVFHDNAGKSFTDWTHDLGLDSARFGRHITIFFYDFDNDGYLDLLLLNEDTLSQLYYGGSQRFAPPVIMPFNNPAQGGLQNISLTDYDNDGFMDILHNSIGKIDLWHNEGNANRWLTVSLRGHQANSNGIGSRVIAYANGRRQNREVGYSQGNYGYLPLLAHFGFGLPGCEGDNGVIDSVVIVWQPGGRQVLKNVRYNQTILVDQDSGIVRAFERPIQAVGLGTVFPVFDTAITAKPDALISLPVSVYFSPSAKIDTFSVDALTFSLSYNSSVIDISPSKVSQRYTPPPGWKYQSSVVSHDTISVTIANISGAKLADSSYLGRLKFDTYSSSYSGTLIFLAGVSVTSRSQQYKCCTSIEGSIITHVTVDTLSSSVASDSTGCAVTTNLTILPNPSEGGQIRLHFPDARDTKASVRVIDILGREIYRVDGLPVPSSAGVAEIFIPSGAVTNAGSYIIEVSTDVQTVVGRLVVDR
ncbi:MAG TPA: FG-GAP-like repeat-containing protein [Candidatus Kapabacteria bacterium]|nr:FG-GAP-like repeat-containing protein [Candidatus Kapabacteria bacterium]